MMVIFTYDIFRKIMIEFIGKYNSKSVINNDLSKGCFLVRDVFPEYSVAAGRWLRQDTLRNQNTRQFPDVEYVGVINGINYYKINEKIKVNSI